MYDIVLFAVLLAIFAGGYFVVVKAGEYIGKNYKGYEYETEESGKEEKKGNHDKEK